MARNKKIKRTTIGVFLGVVLLVGCQKLFESSTTDSSKSKPGRHLLEFFTSPSREFDSGTITVDVVPGNDDVIRAAAFQTDGRIVLAGRTFNGTFNRFGVARYFPNGVLDTSFGSDGAVVTEIFPGSWGWAHAVAVTSDQKIVAFGRVYDLQSYNWMVVRYLSNGVLDTTFSSDGIVNLDPIGDAADFGRAIVIQSDDKIVVGGPAGGTGNYDFGFARFQTDGTLDPTFNSDGIHNVNINGRGDVLHAIALDSNDRIVASGYTVVASEDQFALVRLETDGSMDTTLDGDGIQTLDIGADAERAFAMDIGASNTIYVAGRTHNSSNYDFAVARFTEAGARDTTFDGDGVQTLAIGTGVDSAHGIALSKDDVSVAQEFYVGGRTWNGSLWDFAVVRYFTNGSLDTTFGSNGITTTGIGPGHNVANSLLFDFNRLILAGYAENSSSNRDFAIARYNSDGSLATAGAIDRFFSTDGIRIDDVTGGHEQYRSATKDSEGRILTVGWDANGDVLVARYSNDGTPDTTFSTDGFAQISLGGGTDRGYGIAVDSQDRAIIAGRDDGEWAVLRVLTNGSQDATFGTTAPGYTIINFGGSTEFPFDVKIDNQDRIVMVGFDRGGDSGGDRDPAVARLLTNGHMDATFSGDGAVTIDTGDNDARFRAVAIQSDDKIIAVGETDASGSDQWMVSRFLTNGTLDADFSGGTVTFSFSASSHQAHGVVIDGTGKYVVGGDVTTDTADVGIARFNTDGSLDNTFGTGGGVGYIVHPNGDSVAGKMDMDASGKFILVFDYNGGADDEFGIARFNQDGTPDSTFDGDGIVHYDVDAANDDRPYAAVVNIDGRIVIAGLENQPTNNSRNPTVMRIWP